MKLFTAQMSRWRLAGELGIEFLDTTVKTGQGPFAPTWEIVMGSKEGKITHEEYTERYLEMMRKSYRDHPEYWETILRKENLVIACYCPAGHFCHRHILKDILEKVAIAKGIPFKYLGEL